MNAAPQVHQSEPTIESSQAVLSLSPCTAKTLESKDELYFAVKYAPPTGASMLYLCSEKMRYWSVLSPLTDTLYRLRRDWHDLSSAADAPSDVLRSDKWLEKLRQGVDTFGCDTQLDGKEHGKVRWQICEDHEAFLSATGMLLDRLWWTMTDRPYVAVKVESQSSERLWRSRLYGERMRMPAYESTLLTLFNHHDLAHM